MNGEILKLGGGKIKQAVWKMCRAAWNTEKVPFDWHAGNYFPAVQR